MVNKLLLMVIRGYQKFLRPVFGNRCRFTPSCSQYACLALESQGCLKACWLIIKRLLKCHPLHPGGVDYPR